MYNLLLNLIMFASLGVVIYLMARAVPRVNDAGEPAHAAGKIDRLLSRLPLGKIDAKLGALGEKTLRKLKVVLMRLDNLLTYRLNRMKKNGNGKKQDLFSSGERDNNS